MADQVPPEGEAPEAQPPQQGDQPAEQGQAAGPSRPPPSSGTPPMTATRMRLGTGRGPTPSRPGGQTPAAGQSTPPVPSTPPAEPPSEQPAEPTPTPAARPAAQPAAQSQRDGAEEQLATEMGAGAVEPTAEADEVPTEPAPPARPATPPAAPPN